MKRLNFLLLFLFFPNIAMAKAIDEVVTYGSKISPGAFGIMLVASVFHARHWFYLKIRDGWSWDKNAQRALFVSALSTNILYLYWPEKVFLHVATQWWIFSGVIANAVLRWALTENILRVKFQDLFEIKRHRLSSHKFTQVLSSLGILACCGSLLSFPWFPFSQDIILAAAIAWSCSKLDWIYILRNSPLSSTLFALSTLCLGLSLPLHIDALSYVMIFIMLGASFLRIRTQLAINREAILVTKAAFASMQTVSNGAEKLDALCTLLQDEWAMARVSVVTIENKYGTLVASAGPQALNTNSIVPQILGPILKRVCREAHSVYSPVAGELGKENVFHRLRHSSFAVPIFFQEKIAAVICFMAEGEEKIDPQDVRAMDMVCRQITPEILAAISITKLESKNSRLQSLLKKTNALLLEEEHTAERRILVRAELNCCHGILPALESRYRQEVFAAWEGLREVFGFLSMERNDSCFWAIAPLQLENPFAPDSTLLTTSILLAELMTRQADLISRDDGFRALTVQGAKLILAIGDVKTNQEKLSPTIFNKLDALAKHSKLQFGEIYSFSIPGDLLVASSAIAPQPICIPTHSEVYAWKELSLDRKEIRRLESLAQQKLKDRRGAA